MKKEDIKLALVFVHPYSVFYKVSYPTKLRVTNEYRYYIFKPNKELAKKSMKVWNLFEGLPRAVFPSENLDEKDYLEKCHLYGKLEPEYEGYYKKLAGQWAIHTTENNTDLLTGKDKAEFKNFVDDLKQQGIHDIVFIGGEKSSYVEAHDKDREGCLCAIANCFKDFHRWLVWDILSTWNPASSKSLYTDRMDQEAWKGLLEKYIKNDKTINRTLYKTIMDKKPEGFYEMTKKIHTLRERKQKGKEKKKEKNRKPF